MVINVLAQRYAVCMLEKATLPEGEFVSLSISAAEISLVCEEARMPKRCVRAEKGWRALRVKGPLDFTLTGILAELSAILANAGVSIFAVSTYETDYILVKDECIKAAKDALVAQGHSVLENKS